MKIRNSLKSLMKRHRDNQMVRRRGSRLHHQQDAEALQGAPGLSPGGLVRGPFLIIEYRERALLSALLVLESHAVEHPAAAPPLTDGSARPTLG